MKLRFVNNHSADGRSEYPPHAVGDAHGKAAADLCRASHKSRAFMGRRSPKACIPQGRVVSPDEGQSNCKCSSQSCRGGRGGEGDNCPHVSPSYLALAGTQIPPQHTASNVTLLHMVLTRTRRPPLMMPAPPRADATMPKIYDGIGAVRIPDYCASFLQSCCL